MFKLDREHSRMPLMVRLVALPTPGPYALLWDALNHEDHCVCSARCLPFHKLSVGAYEAECRLITTAFLSPASAERCSYLGDMDDNAEGKSAMASAG